MKILLTGGGTGGHFYPLIAIIEAIYEISTEERLLPPEIILMSDSIYNNEILEKEGVRFKKINTGKLRRYFSLLNITDIVKTFFACVKTIWFIYSEMPDVIMGKGGYASFPALLAAKIFGIPTIIHESDTIPGKVNLWASKFAQKIAISFPESIKYFPTEKTALTGVPIRKLIQGFTPEEGREQFFLENGIPAIFVLGGSQGSQKINDIILDVAPEILKTTQIIHQYGSKNEKEINGRIKIILGNSLFKNRYHAFAYLNDVSMRNAASAADLIISRAGASALYEISTWGIPSIIIPLKDSAQNHQRENAYSYAGNGAATVLEEENLSPHILMHETQKILRDNELRKKMSRHAKNFSKPEAARKIAKELINMALEHTK